RRRRLPSVPSCCWGAARPCSDGEPIPVDERCDVGGARGERNGTAQQSSARGPEALAGPTRGRLPDDRRDRRRSRRARWEVVDREEEVAAAVQRERVTEEGPHVEGTAGDEVFGRHVARELHGGVALKVDALGRKAYTVGDEDDQVLIRVPT